MDQATYDKIKAACLKFREGGGEIITGAWSVQWFRDKWSCVDDRCACALGAFLLETQPTRAKQGTADYSCASALSVPIEMIDAFVWGFDCDDDYGAPRAPEAEQWTLAGRRLREELGVVS